MLDNTALAHRYPPRPAVSWRVYARLAKLDIYDYYLATPLLLAMVLPAQALSAEGAAVLLLFLLGGVAMFAGLCSFDDITGYRDGSDAANYGPDAPARRLARKPLIAGALGERQAQSFAWLAIAVQLACWSGAVLLAPARPGWTLLATAACAFAGFQYSWWLKLSYRGWQEFLLAFYGWVFVLVPYGLLTGRLDSFALVQGLVFGLGPLLFGVYSNVNDIAGDRAVGRRTVAVLASPAGNAAFVAALSLLEAALLTVPSLLGLAPWWFAVLMVPVIALRASQFTLGLVAGQILRARRLGIHTHRVCCALLVAACLLNGGAA
ncbi:UbiA family prenyltransferase [Kitasatospora sp. NBC_01287]|uniref:UbiA family prenyltransferase n=1 Tax=Kitasatospora sp. NBC_01287 TaxID=2903573 RepID=UPI002252DED3|nr:UbiA family prenyltransferase [Kitasatospora sp. NBC_01287]MCX4747956.1 UbiA family prenyltransferase [Kitasatospora sp. NBC_01287]